MGHVPDQCIFACCEERPRSPRVVRNPFLTLKIQLLQLSVATAALVVNQPHPSTNSQADGSGLPTATGRLCNLCCPEERMIIRRRTSQENCDEYSDHSWCSATL